MYDRRERAERDYAWTIAAAYAEGYKEGFEQGYQEGLNQGRAAVALAGKIQALQEELGESVMGKAELIVLPKTERESLYARLRGQCKPESD